MSELVNKNVEVTMSSREISELTGKRHDNVKNDIDRMLNDLGEDILKFQGIYIDKMNRQQIEYNLDRRHVDCLLTGYSALLRMKVIDRWHELESKNKTSIAIPQTFAEALRLAADQAEQIALMAPKADVFDKIVDRNNLYNATQVAQKVGKSAVWLNRHLESMDVYNRSVKRGRAFQQWFVEKGYGIMRETETGHSQPMFYAEGEMWVIEKLTAEGII